MSKAVYEYSNQALPLIRKKEKNSPLVICCQGKTRTFSVHVITLGYMLFLTSFPCQASVLHLKKKDKMMTWSKVPRCYCFFCRSLMKSWVSCQFWRCCLYKIPLLSEATPLVRVICPSPLRRFHEAVLPPSPNITIASHLPWILSCSIATAHSHSIPFPFLQGPHKVNPNLFARDGLIMAVVCLSSSCTLHRDNRALLLIHMQLFILYFIYLDSELWWSLGSQSKLKQQLHSFEWTINNLNDTKVLIACNSVEYHIPSVKFCIYKTYAYCKWNSTHSHWTEVAQIQPAARLLRSEKLCFCFCLFLVVICMNWPFKLFVLQENQNVSELINLLTTLNLQFAAAVDIQTYRL